MLRRAVKFIREQAQNDAGKGEGLPEEPRKSRTAASRAQTLFKFRRSADERRSPELAALARLAEHPRASTSTSSRIDPSEGWSDGVSIRKSHLCLLLKPQFCLQMEHRNGAKGEKELPPSTVVISTTSASLQSFDVVDNEHADDPVNGHIMVRLVTSVSSISQYLAQPLKQELCLAQWPPGFCSIDFFKVERTVPLWCPT
jgi:hypothetical protein